MLVIRQEKASDVAAREALLDTAYGAARFAKPSQRLRKDRSPAAGLSLVAIEDGHVIGTVRLWQVVAGAERSALLLGPLAVHPDCRNRGLGSTLMRRALAAARRRGHHAVLLVGDASYYGRFGFSAETTGALHLPGLHDRHRLLGHELKSGALSGMRGTIRVPRPAPANVDGIAGRLASIMPHAA